MHKILVVDDCEEMLFVLRLVLEDLGHRVRCLASRDEASVQAAIKFEPDCAILDVQMPGLTVPEFVAAIRPAKVILASGDVPTGRLLADELDLPLLEKPFTGDELLAALNVGEYVAS
jgi:CheY-like chemotaxis protein